MSAQIVTKALIGLFLSAVFFVGCTSTPTEEDAIAEVNGLKITIKDYMDLFDSLKPGEVNPTEKERPHIRNLVIQTLVRRAVIITKADANNVTVTEKELEAGIEKFKSGYSDQLFYESLLEGMMEEEEWRNRVRENILIQKMFEASKPQIQKPTTEEALEYFQNHPQLFLRPAEATARHIVVGDEKVANEIRSKISSRKLGFLAAAKEFSVGPEAKENAEITVEKETLPEPLDKYLFEGPLKTLSPVIESPYGFHLLEVLRRRPPINLDFKDVQTDILKRLHDERRQAWLERFEETLIRESEIAYNRELIKKL